MLDQYRRIIELFGQSPDDPISRQFVKDLGETPSFASGSYVFPKTGFLLFCDRRNFVMAFFHIANPATEPGGYSQPYSGDLPAGIRPEDSRQDVQHKLGVDKVDKVGSGLSTLSSSAYSCAEVFEDWYSVPPFELKFTFNIQNDKLNSFSVRFDDEHMPAGFKSTSQYKETMSSDPTKPHRPKRNRSNRHRRSDS